MPREKVLGILSEEGGTKIDPGCVAILEELAAKDALWGQVSNPPHPPPHATKKPGG
jgi:hypothetical protein